MDPVDILADRIWTAAEGAQERYIVAIAGIPGSGKSTLAYPLANRINTLSRQAGSSEDVAICIGVDGWHYSQAQLRSMENPTMLFARRGAHFTFDATLYATFIHSLSTTPTVDFPSFSHADKDPIPGGSVLPSHRIVLIEGLHALLAVAPWSTAAEVYKERIWVHTPRAEARERLVARHVEAGVEATVEAARRRVDDSDILNADTLLRNLVPPTVVVDSVTGEMSYPKPGQGVPAEETAGEAQDSCRLPSSELGNSCPAVAVV